MTTAGGCGDTVRNITGCPVAGLDRRRAVRLRPALDEAADFFVSHRDYLDLPRKHKITIATCADQCNAPEINCIALDRRASSRTARLGFAVRVGGGLSTTPRIGARPRRLRRTSEALEVPRAILDVWRHDLKYRLSRAKARLKFMVDDYGAEGVREAVEERLGRQLEDLAVPPPPARRAPTTSASTRRSRTASSTSASRSSSARSPATRCVAIADLAESFGGDIRLTRQQNFILTGVPGERVDEVVAQGRRDRLPAGRRPAARHEHRLHRPAALQLRGRRDQAEAAARSWSAWSACSGRRSTAEPGRRRLPARLRPPLDRGHRAPGHDRCASAAAGRAAGGVRDLPARRSRRGCDDRPARSASACPAEAKPPVVVERPGRAAGSRSEQWRRVLPDFSSVAPTTRSDRRSRTAIERQAVSRCLT